MICEVVVDERLAWLVLLGSSHFLSNWAAARSVTGLSAVGGVDCARCAMLRERGPRGTVRIIACRDCNELRDGIRVVLADEATGKRATIDREGLRVAVGRLATCAPHAFADLVAQRDDAHTTDVLCQVALHGEVLYG